LGDRIRSARIAAGMTVPALADKLGLSVAAVKKIQRGEATTQFLKFGDLCRALDTTPNQLLGFADEANSSAHDPDPAQAPATLETALRALGIGAQVAPLMASEILRIMTTAPMANETGRKKTKAPRGTSSTKG
jgi:transcriptional regulator with XRE-family HTH domain